MIDGISKILSNGRRKVRIGLNKTALYGFLDANNEIVIPLIYQGARDFSEGLAAVRIGCWNTQYWGFINTKGEVVIPPVYENPKDFSNGMAKVLYKGKYYFINPQGERVICLDEYDGCNRFSHECCHVWKKLYKNGFIDGYINKEGLPLGPFNFYRIEGIGDFNWKEFDKKLNEYNAGLRFGEISSKKF